MTSYLKVKITLAWNDRKMGFPRSYQDLIGIRRRAGGYEHGPNLYRAVCFLQVMLQLCSYQQQLFQLGL